MRNLKQMLSTFVLALALAATAVVMTRAEGLGDYRFKVHNNTNVKLTKILVSEDGKDWGFFDIGSGIAAGATTELVWAKHTDNSGCDWYFKAQWSDGETSDPTKFDFCEEGLVLEFSK